MDTKQIDRQEFIKDNIQVNLDKQKLLEEAEWKVRFHEKEVINAYQNLELSKMALRQLQLGYEAQLQ
jgi:hypothetical protein